jgi:signal transduction histidine kinase
LKRVPVTHIHTQAPPAITRHTPSDTGVHLRDGMHISSVSDADREALSCLRHDLRSLLNSVVGFSELLGSGSYGPLTPAQSSFVDHLRNSAGKLNERFDVFVELSHQEEQRGSNVDLPLFAALHHAFSGYEVGLLIDEEIKQHRVTLDLSCFRRALERTVDLLTAHGSGALHCHATLQSGRVALLLDAREHADTPPHWFRHIDDVTDKVDSQTLIEIRLAQRLFERQDIALALDYSLFAAHLLLP